MNINKCSVCNICTNCVSLGGIPYKELRKKSVWISANNLLKLTHSIILEYYKTNTWSWSLMYTLFNFIMKHVCHFTFLSQNAKNTMERISELPVLTQIIW